MSRCCWKVSSYRLTSSRALRSSRIKVTRFGRRRISSTRPATRRGLARRPRRAALGRGRGLRAADIREARAHQKFQIRLVGRDRMAAQKQAERLALARPGAARLAPVGDGARLPRRVRSGRTGPPARRSSRASSARPGAWRDRAPRVSVARFGPIRSRLPERISASNTRRLTRCRSMRRHRSGRLSKGPLARALLDDAPRRPMRRRP